MQTQPAPAEPEGRACAACGASSPATSSYCWQCFKPFSTVPASTQPAPGGDLPPFNQPQPILTPPPPKRSRTVGGRIVVGVVVALVAAGVTGRFTKTHFSFPEQIAGTPRMHTTDAQQFEAQVDRWGKDSENLPLKGAAYGNGPQADFLIGAAEGGVKNSVDDIERIVYETITGETFDRSVRHRDRHTRWARVPVRGRRQRVDLRVARLGGLGLRGGV